MLKVDPLLCVGCGLCSRVCPQGAIKLIGGKAYVEEEKCIRCYQCVKVCPRGAIKEEEVAKGQSVQDISRALQDIRRKIEYLKGRINAMERGRWKK